VVFAFDRSSSVRADLLYLINRLR